MAHLYEYQQHYNSYNTNPYPPPPSTVPAYVPPGTPHSGFIPQASPAGSPNELYDQVPEYICDVCKIHYFSGSVYHCSRCLDGNFDMCEACSMQGRTCSCGPHNQIVRLIVIPGKGRKLYKSERIEDMIDLQLPLSEFIPTDVTLREPYRNPALEPFVIRFLEFVERHTNPSFEQPCNTIAEYEEWETETYKPQKAYYEDQLAGLNPLYQDILHFAKYDMNCGSKGWEWQTKDGESVDTFDLMMQIMMKADKTSKEMSDLTDEMNRNWAGAEINNARATGNMDHAAACDKWFSTVIREEAVNFGKAKYERFSETLKDTEQIMKRAETLEKFAYDSLLMKLTIEVEALKAGARVQSTHEERKRALTVLNQHYEIRLKLHNRLFNVRKSHIKAYLQYRLCEAPENEAAIKAECESSLAGATSLGDSAGRDLANEHDSRVTQILSPAISGSSTATPLPQYSQPPAAGLPGSSPLPQYASLAPPSPLTQYSTIQPPASPAMQHNNLLAPHHHIPPPPPVQPNPPMISSPAPSTVAPSASPTPGYQMPLSWYSNMLTQQHAVSSSPLRDPKHLDDGVGF